MKRLIFCMVAAVLLCACVCGSAALPSAYAEAYIDNSDVMPLYVPDDQVLLEDSGNVCSPDWAKTLIAVQVRIETATPEGTFQAAERLLDHYQETGVNGLWLTPIYDRTEATTDENGYGNLGLHTVWPKLTGCDNYEDSWEVVRQFVQKAHERNIRIFFDIISWGTTSDAPLRQEHPEFYSGMPGWGGHLFAWHSRALQEWFTEQAVELMLKTGADGFRCDLEPGLFAYGVYGEVRARLLERGRKIMLLSELPNERNDTYDFEENGVGMVTDADNNYTHEDDVFLKKYNLVESVLYTGKGIGSKEDQLAGTSGYHRFYTYCIQGCNHFDYVLRGSRLRIGYNALFAPFIPIWFMGDEWNNDSQPFWGTTVMYFSRLVWEQRDQPENRAFFEDVKRMIRIRRTYPELFEYFPDSLRDTNICAVDIRSLSSVAGYARYAKDKLAVIVPNDDVRAIKATVTVPYEAAGLSAQRVRVTDLLTGKVIAEGKREELETLRVQVAEDSVGVYLVEAVGVTPTTSATAPSGTAGSTTATVAPETTATMTASATAAATTGAPTTSQTASAPVQTEGGGAAVYTVIIAAALVVLAAAVAVILRFGVKRA